MYYQQQAQSQTSTLYYQMPASAPVLQVPSSPFMGGALSPRTNAMPAFSYVPSAFAHQQQQEITSGPGFGFNTDSFVQQCLAMSAIKEFQEGGVITEDHEEELATPKEDEDLPAETNDENAFQASNTEDLASLAQLKKTSGWEAAQVAAARYTQEDDTYESRNTFSATPEEHKESSGFGACFAGLCGSRNANPANRF